MKLMQHNYLTISKLEVELRQLEEATVPSRPRKSYRLLVYHMYLFCCTFIAFYIICINIYSCSTTRLPSYSARALFISFRFGLNKCSVYCGICRFLILSVITNNVFSRMFINSSVHIIIIVI